MNEVPEPITFVLAYPTVSMQNAFKVCTQLQGDPHPKFYIMNYENIFILYLGKNIKRSLNLLHGGFRSSGV